MNASSPPSRQPKQLQLRGPSRVAALLLVGFGAEVLSGSATAWYRRHLSSTEGSLSRVRISLQGRLRGWCVARQRVHADTADMSATALAEAGVAPEKIAAVLPRARGSSHPRSPRLYNEQVDGVSHDV